jgi:uncharacterized phage protein (predicted DNA packaging)
MTELLAKIKTSLRISHTALDEDITDTISACLADLRVCGVREEVLDTSKELPPLILVAVKLYCKADYTDDTAKAARYKEGYDNLKAVLMMAEGYGYEEEASDD